MATNGTLPPETEGALVVWVSCAFFYFNEGLEANRV